jgi:hypothetical protein
MGVFFWRPLGGKAPAKMGSRGEEKQLRSTGSLISFWGGGHGRKSRSDAESGGAWAKARGKRGSFFGRKGPKQTSQEGSPPLAGVPASGGVDVRQEVDACDSPDGGLAVDLPSVATPPSPESEGGRPGPVGALEQPAPPSPMVEERAPSSPAPAQPMANNSAGSAPLTPAPAARSAAPTPSSGMASPMTLSAATSLEGGYSFLRVSVTADRSHGLGIGMDSNFVVTELRPDGPGELAGIEIDDQLVEVNRVSVFETERSLGELMPPTNAPLILGLRRPPQPESMGIFSDTTTDADEFLSDVPNEEQRAMWAETLKAGFGEERTVLLQRPSPDFSLGVEVEYREEAHGLPEIIAVRTRAAPPSCTRATPILHPRTPPARDEAPEQRRHSYPPSSRPV